MEVFIPERWYANQPELRASMKIFPVASPHGINQGKISKLAIQLRIENPIAKVQSRLYERVETLFNYDRGLDVDHLKEHAAGKALYDLVIKLAN